MSRAQLELKGERSELTAEAEAARAAVAAVVGVVEKQAEAAEAKVERQAAAWRELEEQVALERDALQLRFVERRAELEAEVDAATLTFTLALTPNPEPSP